MRLDELGEFGLLRQLWSDLGPPGRGVILGSGDDAAALSLPGGRYLLVSTDAMAEGSHFRPGWLTPNELGERACRAALSDLAAMGGTPLAVLASLALAPATPAEDARALLAGLRAAAERFGASLAGGDLVASPGPLFLDVVVLGETTRYWTRAGASPGDLLLVSGDLGRSAAALRRLLAGASPADLPPAERERFLRPVPAFDLVEALQPLGVVTAAIDLSDGLLADLGHLAERSGVQLSLQADLVPLAPELREAAPPQWDLTALALGSGEEYELAFTAPADALAGIEQAVAGAGARPVTVIGQVRAGRGVTVEGAPPGLAGGYDHFGAG